MNIPRYRMPKRINATKKTIWCNANTTLTEFTDSKNLPKMKIETNTKKKKKMKMKIIYIMTILNATRILVESWYLTSITPFLLCSALILTLISKCLSLSVLYPSIPILHEGINIQVSVEREKWKKKSSQILKNRQVKNRVCMIYNSLSRPTKQSTNIKI